MLVTNGVPSMIVVTSAEAHGPVAHTFPDMSQAVAWLVALGRHGIKLDTETVWKRKGRAWVPAFPWQHGDRA